MAAVERLRSTFKSSIGCYVSFQTSIVPAKLPNKLTVPCFNTSSTLLLCRLIVQHFKPELTHPSRIDSLQQYRLSNFCFVTESLTFMAGTHSFPALDSWYNLNKREEEGRGHFTSCWCMLLWVCYWIFYSSVFLYKAIYYLWTPVTLSSTMPLIFLNTLGYFLYIQCVKSPPSSRI